MPSTPHATVEQANRLRQLLDQHHYHEEGIAQLLGEVEAPSRTSGTLPRLLHRASGNTPQAVLIRLFFLGVAVETAVAAAAVEPILTLAELGAMGLIDIENADVVARVTICPVDGMLATTDRFFLFEENPPADFVLGVTASTRLLGEVTLRQQPMGSMLDLGCGFGYQALRSSHAGRVIATDINPRACAYTEFNAALNGAPNLEVRLGSGFEPVSGMTFDSIVSNLPFVISPSRHYIYRDAGLPADDFARVILQDAPKYLTLGGYGQFMLSWVHRAGREPIQEWLANAGCHAWVITTMTQDVASYAEAWIRETETRDPRAACTLFDEWMRYYEREQIERIDTGLVILQKTDSRTPWFHVQTAPDLSPLTPGLSQWIVSNLRRFQLLSELNDDEQWLEHRWRPAPALNIVQVSRPSADGTWSSENPAVTLPGPVVATGNLDRQTLRLLMQFDGRRTTAAVADEFAAAVNAQPAQVRAACLGIVKRWVDAGILESSDGAQPV